MHPTLVGKICDTIALQAVERSPELFPRDLLHEIETKNPNYAFECISCNVEEKTLEDNFIMKRKICQKVD